MNLERLYLDYNATSPLSQSVLNWLKSGDVVFANPSSQHSQGKAARKVINEARAFLFKTFSKSERETKLFFHSGATEAFHTFAHSFSEVARREGRELLICFSKVDHPAVSVLQEKHFGNHVSFYELERDSNLHYRHQENLELLKKEKDKNPDLLILYHHLWVHNETGQVSPLEELSPFKSIPDLFLHIDGVQAPGKIPEWKELTHGDMWTFSGHKFGSLKGIGFTFLRSETPFIPLISGGGQQGNMRSGTENVQGIGSLVLALQDLLKVDVEKNQKIRRRLLDFFRQELQGIGDVIEDKRMASNTIYFYLNTLTSDVALALFDIHGVEISAGSACSSGAAKASPVLLQKGLTSAAKNGLRLSMGFSVDEDLLNKIEERLAFIFNKLRP